MRAMGSALNTAISGLHAAEARVASASSRVTDTARAEISQPDQTISPPPSPNAQAPERPAGIRPPTGLNDTDLIRDVIDLKAAEAGYKVAAKVLTAIKNTEDSLLDIFS